jgi:hypothetical protein
MRTQSEIIERINRIKSKDFFGEETSDLLRYLDFGNAQPFLKPEAQEEAWNKFHPSDQGKAKSEAREYMSFAVEKCVSHRGLSAERSVSHMRAWFWIMGDDEMVSFIDDRKNYPNYGAPILAEAHKRLGLDLPEDQDFLLMAKGEPCSGCATGNNVGCGR